MEDTEGRVVREVAPPTRRQALSTNIDWDAMARLARLTKQPVLAATNSTESQVKSLRLRKRSPFITEEGKIIVKMRNSSVEDGVRRGEIYFEWQPTTPKESK